MGPVGDNSVIIAIAFTVAIGVMYVLYMRGRQQTTTQPQVVVVPDPSADIPQVQNMIQAVHALTPTEI